MYSFGVLLWEIVTGIVPTRGGLSDVSVPEECPAEIADLIQVPRAGQPLIDTLHRVRVEGQKLLPDATVLQRWTSTGAKTLKLKPHGF